MFREIILGLTIAIASRGITKANETIDPFARKLTHPDLKFPDQPSTASQDKPRPGSQDMNMMFRPDGAGPFPALVIMPVCGANHVTNAFDWACASCKAATRRSSSIR